MSKEKDQRIRSLMADAREKGLTHIQAQTLARFIVERFPNKAHLGKWVERFKKGKEWHKMDNESQKAYLKVLTTSWGGTRQHIREEALNDFLDERGE